MKRCILFVLIINSLFFTALGNIPDSLESRLKHATTDSAKVMAYNDFVRDLMSGQNRDYYHVLQYSQQGGLNQYYNQALQYAQQGLEFAEKVQFDRGLAELHRTIGNAYFYLTDYEKAIENYEQALQISEKTHDLHGVALNYYNISLAYQTQRSNTYYSLDILQRALLIWKQLGYKSHITRAYEAVIQIYRDVGEWQLAETYAEEALSLALETGNRQEEAMLYETLAQIKFSTGNIHAQIEYYHKSLQIYEKLGDQLLIADITRKIATNLYSKNPVMAIMLLRKSAAIYEEITPASTEFFAIYNSLADMFQLQDNHDSTRYYKEKALSKAILSDNPQTMANAYNAIGEYYLDKGNISRAEKEFLNAYDIAIKSGMYNILSKALSGLSSINHRKGNYNAAFDYLRRYQIINDSLNRDENRRNVQQLAMQYEYEKDLTEKNESIKTQLDRQQHAIKYQKTVVAIISVALIFAAILLGFILNSSKRNHQANLKLEQQHVVILRVNQELQESHHELSMYKDHLEEMVKEQTAKLQQSELQLRTLSDNLPGGCIYQKRVDENGKEIISYISNTAEEWLGISADSIMSDIDRFYRQMDSEDLEKKRQLEQESIISMSSHSCEYRMINEDQELWLLENAVPRTYKDQNIVWDGIIVNITDRKKFEKDLIEAKEHAEESDRLKSTFLANISHEIRTPMNGIVGFLGFIERDDLPIEKRHAYTGVIRSNVQQLLQLIGDIIDISKIDSHQLALHQITFDLNNLMNELEIFFQDFILKRDKKLELMLDCSQFISPCIVKSDPVRIRQIISNLIGNAIKFTEMGYVRFGYSLTEQSDQLYFFVEDTGIGIPQSKLDKIFERFRQVHDEEVQVMYGGTGLGLAISKSLVELMGGQVGVDSKEGFGSTFYFTLPYQPDVLPE